MSVGSDEFAKELARDVYLFVQFKLMDTARVYGCPRCGGHRVCRSNKGHARRRHRAGKAFDAEIRRRLEEFDKLTKPEMDDAHETV